MNFPFYIARRYLISKKSHNIINIISAISVVGVAIGAMALIIVLSVFNGFEKLVVSLFGSFNPDIEITVRHGKTFDISKVPMEKLAKIPGVLHLSEIIEEDALIRYKEKQAIVTIKGVGEGYAETTGIDSMMVEGAFALEEKERDFAVLGYGIAATLGANLQDYLNPLAIYVPSRDASFSGPFENAFHSDVVFPSGFFSIQMDYDIKYVLLPLRFVKRLLKVENERTALELSLATGADGEKVQKVAGSLLGPGFVVKNRFQQQELLYKIMKSEKLYIFLILTFILFMATFNVIGSLSMLILDKRKDIVVLRSLGADQRQVRRVFFIVGMMISFLGAVSGLILGALACWLQVRYGLIGLGDPDSSFVVNDYPVNMQFSDFLLVFATVLSIGFLAAWYPVYNIRKIDTGYIQPD